MPSRFTVAIALLSVMFLLGCSGTLAKQTYTSLPNAATPLVTPTYDGSGQAMHPSVVRFASPWAGYTYWMAMTPYPNNDATVENPSILVSNDGTNWGVPPNLVNPIAPRAGAHLNDVDLIYEPESNQLWAYYLEEDFTGHTLVLRRTSGDGVNWSAPQLAFSVSNYTVLSPAVQKTATGYMMWYVNGGSLGCNAVTTTIEYRTSSDGLVWSAPKTVNLTQPGQQPWHIEVRYVPEKNEYWALYPAYPNASCGTTALYFATSPDGINWQVSNSPILSGGVTWDHDQIYRSTFLYDADKDLLRVWYSAQQGHVWHTGYTEGVYSNLQR